MSIMYTCMLCILLSLYLSLSLSLSLSVLMSDRTRSHSFMFSIFVNMMCQICILCIHACSPFYSLCVSVSLCLSVSPVMIRNWCCSFIMCSYETVFWLPSFWSSAMALRLTSKWLERFLLPLVYLWDCILQHGGSGKKRTSSSWSIQPPRPLNSTDPKTILFDQRLGRRIFPPVNLGQSNLRLFKFLASLGLQASNLGQGGTSSSVVQKESPCTFFLQQPCRTFRANRCVALIPCECKPKGNNCIKRILWSLAQLYTLIYALRTAFCYCDQWLRPRTVCQCRDALLCSSVYRHKIDAVQDSMSGWWMRTLKQNSGSREHLSQYHVLLWMHYHVVGYAFWICVDVACAIHITVVTHKSTSDQIHHHVVVCSLTSIQEARGNVPVSLSAIAEDQNEGNQNTVS